MQSSRKINFLLVDDLEANLVALEALLKRDGLQLFKAKSGTEALEILLVHEIALAFVDVQMPEMSGFELAEVMRGTERTKSVPIIFLTAGAVDPQRRIRGYESGAVDFLLKPIDAAILLNKASTFYDLARQREELRDSQRRLSEANERLERTNAELERADRSKDEFLAMLAHELRNPIAPMLAGVDVMLRSPDNPAVVGKIGAMLKRQTSQMAYLINDLLDVSRITNGKIELRREPVEIRNVIDAAVESVLPLVQQFEHDLALPEIRSGLIVEADPHRLAQVLSNLLTNAAKYTPPGGKISLALSRREDGLLLISIRDNGKGIAPQLQSRVFDLFDQGSSGPKDGLGIGLTLVKSLIEMHGGFVSVLSEGEGMGSEFTIGLPLSTTLVVEIAPEPEPESGTDVAISTGEAAPARKEPLRVLIADDGRPTADVLDIFFRLEGMDTAVAYNGMEAIEKARHFLPDLVCLDLGMPIVDGYEAARRIREIRPQACIVALSGWGSEEDRRRTAAAGFDEHIVKPVNPGDLRDLVARTFP